MAFQEIITPLLTDVYYPSESDEPIEWFVFETESDKPIDEATFRSLLSVPDETPVETLDITAFWEKTTTVQPWFREFELASVEQFEEIQRTVNEHLVDIQGYRIGEIEIGVYLFGKNKEGKLEGIKTILVET